jgi:hypothetical protein
MNQGPQTVEVPLSKLELLLSKDDRFFSFATLEFAINDVSVYIHVDAPHGRYFYGAETIPAGVNNYTFNFANQYRTTDARVHLSIHQSGQVHARVDKRTSTAPVFTVKLPSYTGEHAATLMVDNLDALRETEPNVGEVDGVYRYPLYAPHEAHSARVVLFLNGHEPHFADHCPIVINIRRPNIGTVYLGMRPLLQDRLGEAGKSGIIVLSGMKRLPLDAPMDLVFLRGQ